ncbi:MAG: type I restriction endonuclease, partial [Pirellulales bacterium]
MTTFLDETQAELGILEVIRGLGYDYAPGPEIAPEGERPERASYSDVVLVDRLRRALERINPGV